MRSQCELPQSVGKHHRQPTKRPLNSKLAHSTFPYARMSSLMELTTLVESLSASPLMSQKPSRPQPSTMPPTTSRYHPLYTFPRQTTHSSSHSDMQYPSALAPFYPSPQQPKHSHRDNSDSSPSTHSLPKVYGPSKYPLPAHTPPGSQSHATYASLPKESHSSTPQSYSRQSEA